MSDSYAAYCEQMEQDARLFSSKNVSAVKATRRFKNAAEKAEKERGGTKIREAKVCANCIFNKFINGKAVCAKLGVVLRSVDDLVCSRWRGALYAVPQPKFDEDAVAWVMIDKEKDG